MQTLLRPTLMLFLTLTMITGVLYPLAVTVSAQVMFPREANGSLVSVDGVPVGSALIGQQFTDPGHFWGRPSATSPYPYNAAASSGSNLGPLNPALTDGVQTRITVLRAVDPGNDRPVPIDLVTASGSGLDPDISLAAAYYQAPRVATHRQLPLAEVRALIEQHARRPWLGFFGEPRVNVLALNLAVNRARR